MKKIATVALGMVSAAMLAVAAQAGSHGGGAAAMDSMVGKWKWQDFTVECSKGGEHGLSCKVVEGPKNVGMEMIASAIKKEGDAFVGKVKHPANGQVYNTKMTMADKDSWKLDGCTDDGACATGTFVRVK